MFVLLDNYDSFTYNVAHYLGQLGAEHTIYRNDQITVEQILKNKVNGIVISPGPGTPEKSGICIELIQRCYKIIPILGICLGHQAIGQAMGANVIRLDEPVHGKVCDMKKTAMDSPLLSGLPDSFEATRYHSLIVERTSIPTDLQITATGGKESGIVMAMQHCRYPTFGVQFHPESIGTPLGLTIFQNFIDVTHAYNKT